jgi:hypothetical protein
VLDTFNDLGHGHTVGFFNIATVLPNIPAVRSMNRA